MVDPNWGLMQGNNALNYMQYGMQIGRDARERQNAQELTAAESELFAKPNDPNALASYAKLNPKGAFAYRQDQQKSAAEQRRRELIPLAARGDETALLELWGADPDMAMKLDENSKKKAVDGIKYVASAAYKIKQLPPEQRPAAWDAYIDQGVAQYPGLAEYRGKYSDQSLDSIVAKAGETKMFEEFQQPRYVPLGEQGAIGLQYGRPIPGGPTVNPATQQKAPAAPPPPKEAIEDLRRNPKSAPQFDEIFGQGAAAKALGGASSNASGGFSGFKRAIIAQESGGRYGVTNAEGSGAMGVGQIMPETGAALAKREGLPWRPDLMRGNSAEARAYQDRLTDAALKEAWQYGGGDPEKAAKYYFAGPNQKGWGSKTRRYGADITRRMGAR